MVSTLIRPLQNEHIEAAKQLYEKLPGWGRKNTILADLKARDADLSNPEITLLKVAVLNQFYYTNLWAIDRMADHIVGLDIKRKLDENIKSACLVELFATLGTPVSEETPPPSEIDHTSEIPEDPAQTSTPKQKEEQRMHTSFASKFAHFFISKDTFPIYDTFAVTMVDFHLKQSGTKEEKQCRKKHPYKAFYAQLETLMKLSSLSSFVDIDRYLWLAGLCQEWTLSKETGKAPKINREVKKLFDEDAPEALRKQLFPYQYDVSAGKKRGEWIPWN